MDFRRAMADSPHPYLAEKTLDRQLARIAETAENLDTAVGDALRHFGCLELRDEGLVANFLLGVGHPAGPINQQSRRFQLDLGISQHPLDRLPARDRLAPGGALLGPFDRHVDRALGDSKLERADLQTPMGELIVRHREAAVSLA